MKAELRLRSRQRFAASAKYVLSLSSASSPMVDSVSPVRWNTSMFTSAIRSANPLNYRKKEMLDKHTRQEGSKSGK